MIFTCISTQYAHIFSSPWKRNIISLFGFLTFWLNAIVAMAPSPCTAFYLLQFAENPHTPTNIFITRHTTPNIKSSLLPKFYSAGLALTSQKHSELQNIRSTLQLNGLPTRTNFLTSRRPRSQNIQYNHFTSIPYTQGASEKVRRVLYEAGVRVAIKPVHTIGGILSSPKDPLILEEKSCLWYQVPCFDCDFVYIGQTKLTLSHI